jgi:hypothetical protein
MSAALEDQNAPRTLSAAQDRNAETSLYRRPFYPLYPGELVPNTRQGQLPIPSQLPLIWKFNR